MLAIAASAAFFARSTISEWPGLTRPCWVNLKSAGRDDGRGMLATRADAGGSATSGAFAISARDGAGFGVSGAATTVGLKVTGGAPSEWVTSISAA